MNISDKNSFWILRRLFAEHKKELKIKAEDLLQGLANLLGEVKGIWNNHFHHQSLLDNQADDCKDRTCLSLG